MYVTTKYVKTCFYNKDNKQKCFSCHLGNTPRSKNKCIINSLNYQKTSHFVDMLENTKIDELHKYTEEQYEADLKNWASDSKYT